MTAAHVARASMPNCGAPKCMRDANRCVTQEAPLGTWQACLPQSGPVFARCPRCVPAPVARGTPATEE
jgi:hypothetical protein